MSDALCLRCLMDGSDLPMLRSRWNSLSTALGPEYSCQWIEVDGIIAVADLVNSETFSDKNLQSFPWLSEQAMRHARIIDAHFECATVLPVKFGALFSSESVLRSHVTSRRELIFDQLSRLRDHSEWDIRVLAEKNKIKAKLLETDPALIALAATMPDAAGARYLLQRKLDQQLDQAVQSFYIRFQRQMNARLSRWTLHSIQSECPTSDRPASDQPMHEVIARVCVLLPSSEAVSLEPCMQTLQENHACYSLKAEISGPWPPYHFCPDLHRPRQTA